MEQREDIQVPLSLQGVVCSQPIIITDKFLVWSTPSRLPEKKNKASCCGCSLWPGNVALEGADRTGQRLLGGNAWIGLTIKAGRKGDNEGAEGESASALCLCMWFPHSETNAIQEGLP